ncbi:MAG: hypothetical protein M1831_005174 [Alyxoria varia]|nr:MAG: hypothetical protein M1831_005174 [Alyxoria varia]
MAEHGSTAQVLASGSQDLAALAGLFATEGVERNALVGHLGYGAIISSGISVLGILGLVKSAVKLSLGLNRCRKSGFNVDSLRGFLGYERAETPVMGEMVCSACIDFQFFDDQVLFSKKIQYFDTETRAVFTVGKGMKESLDDQTALIAGNWRYEDSWNQSPWVVALAAFFSFGLTSWLLLVVDHGPRWELWLACAGLHASLLVLVGAPLLHAFQLIKPSHYASKQRLELATGCPKEVVTHGTRLVFSQADVNGGKVVHFHGDTSYVHAIPFKFVMMFFSTLCAVSYVCQYSVLKSASTRSAAIWIAAQAGLALARISFWIWDPSFDDARLHDSRYVTFPNEASNKLTPLALARNTPGIDFKYRFPRWAWDYLQKTSVTQILKDAVDGNPEDLRDDLDASIFTLGLNATDLFSGIRAPAIVSQLGPLKWQVVLHRKDNLLVSPYVVVKRGGDEDMGEAWTFLNERMRHEVQTLPIEVFDGQGDWYRNREYIQLDIKKKSPLNHGIGDKDTIIDTVVWLYAPIDWGYENIYTVKNFYEGLISLRDYRSELRGGRQYRLLWRKCDSISGFDECSRKTDIEDIDEVPRIVGDIRGRGFVRMENLDWEIYDGSEVVFETSRQSTRIFSFLSRNKRHTGTSKEELRNESWILRNAKRLTKYFITRLFGPPNHSEVTFNTPENSC